MRIEGNDPADLRWLNNCHQVCVLLNNDDAVPFLCGDSIVERRSPFEMAVFSIDPLCFTAQKMMVGGRSDPLLENNLLCIWAELRAEGHVERPPFRCSPLVLSIDTLKRETGREGIEFLPRRNCCYGNFFTCCVAMYENQCFSD